MRKLLCLIGIHKPQIIRFQPRRLTQSIWSWFDDVNFDFDCNECGKTRYGAKGRWNNSTQQEKDNQHANNACV